MVEKRSIWWKIYFYIFLVFNLVIFGAFFTLDGVYDGFYKSEIIYEIFEIVLYIVSFVGLFGFIFMKKIFYKDFWIFIFVLSIVDSVGSILVDPSIKNIWWVYIIYIPLYLALYKYAFKMNKLWSENG